MRTVRRLVVSWALAGVALVGACVVATPTTHAQEAPPTDVAGDAAPGPDDAGADRAIPDEGSLAQVADAQARWPGGRTRNEAEIQAAATLPIEDFRYDPLVLKGYAYEVCAGGIRPGAARTFTELQRRFGGSTGSMYSCRERWDAVNDFDCNGTVSNSSSGFYSTCWSNHARGQAIDLMVGTVGGGYNLQRGYDVVNFLLAPDAQGNVNAMARRLGIQQILFADRCWNSDGDRAIASWSQMRECGIGHFDHIHIDMTNPGAAGNVSYWGVTPPRAAPLQNGMLAWDDQTGSWSAMVWSKYRHATARTGQWGSEWDARAAADLDADGEIDDMLFWDRDTGKYTAQRWSGNVSSNLRTGSFARGYDEIIVGDFDGDGRLDDVMLWDRDNGYWSISSWSAAGPTFRRAGYLSAGFDVTFVGDFDDDGRIDDSMSWDRDTGYWSLRSWSSSSPTVRRSGTWSRGYDELVLGDWENEGSLNDMFLWDRDTGYWSMWSWVNTDGDPDGADAEPAKDMVLESKGSGTWSVGYDEIVVGDLDGEGREDDMFVRDRDNGYWTVRSWYRFKPSAPAAGTWPTSWDDFTIGSWS